MDKSPHQKSQLSYYGETPLEYEKEGRGLTRNYRRKADIIRAAVAPLAPSKILEIGAGSGLMTYFFMQSFGGEYTALDLSPEMLKLAEGRIKQKNIRYVCGDGAAPDFPEGYFDAVIGVDIIHHLEDPVSAMSRWKSLARPGGKMCFLETNIYNPINIREIGVEHEVRVFLNTDKNLAKWSKLAGWRAVQVSPAPAYTPGKPEILTPVYDWIDKVSVKIPLWNKLTALWLIDNTNE